MLEAAAVNDVFAPPATLTLVGLVVIAGAVSTVKALAVEVTEQLPLLTITSKFPASPTAGLVMVNVAVFTPLYGAVLIKSTPALLH